LFVVFVVVIMVIISHMIIIIITVVFVIIIIIIIIIITIIILPLGRMTKRLTEPMSLSVLQCGALDLAKGVLMLSIIP
jgi:hypothetical protein